MDDSFWKGQKNQPSGRILYGVIGEENPNHAGVFRFTSTDGISVNDAHVLSQDVDIGDGGDISTPRSGSPCVAVMTTDGSQCFIIGFHRAPRFDENSDDPPVVGSPEDNTVPGDKVYQTGGGAKLMLKRGGAVIVEAGPGVTILMNPMNNQFTIRSSNFTFSADGRLIQSGRKEIGTTEPETIHTDEFLNKVGPSFDRWRSSTGELSEESARHKIELSSVTVVGSLQTATIRTRETYYADGSWVGDGPKYQWGGASANEPAVLGLQLIEVFERLFAAIKKLRVNTAWGPSTAPLPPLPIELNNLQNELSGKILSTFLFLSKDPTKL